MHLFIAKLILIIKFVNYIINNYKLKQSFVYLLLYLGTGLLIERWPARFCN